MFPPFFRCGLHSFTVCGKIKETHGLPCGAEKKKGEKAMPDNTSSRVYFWDNFKGILIFLVVFAHILYETSGGELITPVLNIIYIFHMPAFVFTTGYLSKSSHSRSRESLFGLLSLYFVFNFAMCFAAPGGVMSLLVTPVYSFWYLLAVIAWRASAQWLSGRPHIIPVSVGAALLCGFFGDVTNVLSISRIISFLPFFLAGYMLPAEKAESALRAKPFRRVECALLLLVCGFLSYLFVSREVTLGSMMMEPFSGVFGLIDRGVIFVIAALVILAVMFLLPDRKMPLLSRFGQSSLAVFLLHRLPTIWIGRNIGGLPEYAVLLAAFGASLALTAVFSLPLVERFVRALGKYGSELLLSGFGKTGDSRKLAYRAAVVTLAAAVFAVPLVKSIRDCIPGGADEVQQESGSAESGDVIFRRITPEQQEQFDGCFKLVFAGDLLLLEDQVKLGRQEDGSYDFGDIFDPTRELISSADLAIGVFEGPMAGEGAGYSTSNYDDGKTVCLNYPDEFAAAIKEAGFDLVTTANNHLLDKGESGALRTLDILEQAGLDSTGSYRSAEDKSDRRVKLVETGGLRLAVLSYTFGSNGYGEDTLLEGGSLSYLTSALADPSGANYDRAKAEVAADFAMAKSMQPDLIVVLPHMGTQFLDQPDDYQNTWNAFFREQGADIILSDHTHSVQPVEFTDGKITVNCPGNFMNIYREHNGDCSIIAEVYIDRETRKPVGAAVVPMWITAENGGNYRPVPIAELTDGGVSADDLARVKEVWAHITSTVLGVELPFNMAAERCYLDEKGYLAPEVVPLEITPELESSPLYQQLSGAETVRFVGDSITHGTKNGGYGWFEPLCGAVPDWRVTARGGATTRSILGEVPADSSLYVVAIGTNDVRYRDKSLCAMTAEDYIAQIDGFVRRIREERPDAEFAFVAPWCALENDKACVIPAQERDRLLAEYSAALAEYCGENGFVFSDPTAELNRVFSLEVQTDYLIDWIHPNSTRGIALYSEAVLRAAA